MRALFILVLAMTSYFGNTQNTIEKIYVQTDKPLYLPGEDIWFKVYLTNNKNLPLPLSDKLYYELIGPSGNSIVKSSLDIAKRTFGAITLANTLPGGIYELRINTDWNTVKSNQNVFTKKIQVQKYISPALLMSIKTDKEMYNPTDFVNAKVEVRSLDNRRLSGVPYTFTLYQNGVKLISDHGHSSDDGQVSILAKIPEYIIREDCLLNIIFSYRGNQESVSKSIPIISDALDVQFLPEGGNLIIGYNNTVGLKSIDKNGKPADVNGEILDECSNLICTFNTYHDGMGKFNFTPQVNTKYYAAIQSNSINKLIELPQANSVGAKIEIAEQSEDALKTNIISTISTQVNITIWKLNQKIISNKKSIKPGISTIDFDVTDFVAGLYKIQMHNQDSSILSERMVFVNNQNRMQINIETNKNKYDLRDNVAVKIITTDHKGRPIPAEISVSVANDKIITLADDKQDNILSALLMSNELHGKIHHPSFYFSKEEKAKKALDLIMMTHGWRNYLVEDDSKKYTDYFVYKNVYVGQIVNAKGVGVKKTILVQDQHSYKGKIITSNEDGYFYIDIKEKKYLLFTSIGKKGEAYRFISIKEINSPNNVAAYQTKNNKEIIEIIQKYDDKDVSINYENIFNSEIKLEEGAVLDEVLVTAYKVPLIEIDNTIQGSIITSEAIAKFPTKSMNAIVGNIPIIRGSRSNEIIYFIDGIRTSGTIPFFEGNDYFQLSHEFNPSGIQSYNGSYYSYNYGNAIDKEFYVPLYQDKDEVETRTDFRSTIYWNPLIQTDRNGIANFNFSTSDEITAFKVIAEGVSASGLIGKEEHTFSATKMLNISCKSSKYFVLGDTVEYNMIVNNESNQKINVKCDVQLSSGLKPLNESNNYFSIPALSSQSATIKFLVNTLEDGEVVLTASSDQFKDKIKLNFAVLNPFYINTSSIVTDKNIDTIIVFPNAINGSIKGEWNVIKDPIGTAMNGVSSLLRSPSGCFEQVSSTTFPNIMVLQYMKEAAKKDLAAEKKALDFIKDGYKKLISYETTEGGFDYWGGSKANLRLTAYGLLEFFEMKKVYTGVDQRLIDRTKDFLISKLNTDGNFSDDSYGNKDVLNAYILYALSIVDPHTFSKIETVYHKMIDETNDPYVLALMTMASYHFNQGIDYQNLDNKMVKFVNTTLKKKITAKETMVIAYSNDNNTETTALVTQAILLNKNNLSAASKCISHILTKYKDGNFGSTQATCLSLQAFIKYAIVKGTIDDVDYQFTSGLDTILVNNSNKILANDISRYIKGTKIDLSLRNRLKDTMVSSFDFTWLSRKISDAENSLLSMKTQLSASQILLGDAANLEVTFINKDKNNMIHHPTALIGIPSGLSLNMNLLNDLVEKKAIASFEIFNNYLCLYISGMKLNEIKKINIPLKAEIEGNFQAPASTAYLYYDNANKVYNDGLKVKIVSNRQLQE